jgi:hypothetical protein
VDGLNIVRMIVSPGSSHAAGMDVVGHHVTVVRELPITESAFAVLGNDLPVEELPHFAIRA